MTQYTRISRVRLKKAPKDHRKAWVFGEEARNEAFKLGYHYVVLNFGERDGLTLDLYMRSWVIAACRIPGQVQPNYP